MIIIEYNYEFPIDYMINQLYSMGLEEHNYTVIILYVKEVFI